MALLRTFATSGGNNVYIEQNTSNILKIHCKTCIIFISLLPYQFAIFLYSSGRYSISTAGAPAISPLIFLRALELWILPTRRGITMQQMELWSENSTRSVKTRAKCRDCVQQCSRVAILQLQLLWACELNLLVSEKSSSSVSTLVPHCSSNSTEMFCRCTVTMALQTSAGRCESYYS